MEVLAFHQVLYYLIMLKKKKKEHLAPLVAAITCYEYFVCH